VTRAFLVNNDIQSKVLETQPVNTFVCIWKYSYRAFHNVIPDHKHL
jgi:hypothetical protein